MRAALMVELGAPPEVGEAPDPVPAPGEALVRVRAAGLNPVDLAVCSGRFYRPVPPPPFVPGVEAVGGVESGSRFAPGTRVWGFGLTGAFAERVCIAEDRLVAVPDGLSDELGVALGVAGLAGWMPVRQRGGLVPGEHVLVLGAGSVVGQTAIRAAVLGGAATVVAAARSLEARVRAGSLGATGVADLSVDDLAAALAAACPEGADLVIDPIWGPALVAALGVCRPRARIVQVGNAAQPLVEMPAGAFRSGELDLRGFSLFNQTSEELTTGYTQLAAAVLAGEVEYEVDVVGLEDVARVWGEQAAGTGGRKRVIAFG